MRNASRAIAEASKVEVVERMKVSVMNDYQTLTPTQQQQYKEALEQVMQAKTMKEVREIGSPIYFAMRKNKEQT